MTVGVRLLTYNVSGLNTSALAPAGFTLHQKYALIAELATKHQPQLLSLQELQPAVAPGELASLDGLLKEAGLSLAAAAKSHCGATAIYVHQSLGATVEEAWATGPCAVAALRLPARRGKSGSSLFFCGCHLAPFGDGESLRLQQVRDLMTSIDNLQAPVVIAGAVVAVAAGGTDSRVCFLCRPGRIQFQSRGRQKKLVANSILHPAAAGDCNMRKAENKSGEGGACLGLALLGEAALPAPRPQFAHLTRLPSCFPPHPATPLLHPAPPAHPPTHPPALSTLSTPPALPAPSGGPRPDGRLGRGGRPPGSELHLGHPGKPVLWQARLRWVQSDCGHACSYRRHAGGHVCIHNGQYSSPA